MKFFLDTANVESIKTWAETGLIDGVTTNPSLLSKEGGDVKKIIKEIGAIVKGGDVSVEVTEKEPQKVYEQAKEIAKIGDNIVVKVPCHADYFAVIKRLCDEGITINVTLVFSLLQGLCMCKLGVKYISPFVGRLDDIDEDGMELIGNLRQIIDEYVFINTKILAASIRHVRHFHEAALLGADVVTLPVAVLEKATKHPLTDSGMERFLSDWQKLGIKKFP